jgi:hypothetical protein
MTSGGRPQGEEAGVVSGTWRSGDSTGTRQSGGQARIMTWSTGRKTCKGDATEAVIDGEKGLNEAETDHKEEMGMVMMPMQSAKQATGPEAGIDDTGIGVVIIIIATEADIMTIGEGIENENENENGEADDGGTIMVIDREVEARDETRA